MSLNKKQRAVQIKALFDQDTIDLLTRRHRGGQNGAKGIRYEDFFAMCRLACLAKEYLEEGKDAQMAGQVSDAFVDDLEIFKDSDKFQENYQLKNSDNITWGSGKKSIIADFHNQYLLNTKCGYRSRIKLIVSDLKTVVSLQKNMPIDLQEFAVAEHFCCCETLSQLFQTDNKSREVISYLCARPDQADKVEAVALVLLSAWIDSSASRGEHIRISNLISAAKKRCPFYIRLIGECPDLEKEVEEILKTIPDFTYLIERGFFSWEYLNGLDSGILAYDCIDPKFGKFQSLVLKQRPSSFDELEGLLLS